MVRGPAGLGELGTDMPVLVPAPVPVSSFLGCCGWGTVMAAGIDGVDERDFDSKKSMDTETELERGISGGRGDEELDNAPDGRLDDADNDDPATESGG